MRGILAAFLTLLIALTIISSSAMDDSDASDAVRSGMRVRTDHLTGCQYLTTMGIWGESAITPRVDADGRQVCVAKGVKS